MRQIRTHREGGENGRITKQRKSAKSFYFESLRFRALGFDYRLESLPSCLPDIRATVQLPPDGEPDPGDHPLAPGGCGVARLSRGKGGLDTLDGRDSGLGKFSIEGL